MTDKRNPWISSVNRVPLNHQKKSERQAKHGIKNTNRKAYILKLKKWRLFIRNLGHRFDPIEVKTKLSKFGTVAECTFGKSKEDDKQFAGYAFVQYETKAAADAAMQYFKSNFLNGKRITIDYAIPKEEYITSIVKDDDFKRIKRLADPIDSPQKQLTQAQPNKRIKFEKKKNCESYDAQNSDDDEIAHVVKSTNQSKKDVAIEEGRVVFVRNLSFDTTSESLEDYLSQFGQLDHALIVKYPGTEHSKGCAFAQFKDKAAAVSCIEASQNDNSPLTLDRRTLICNSAIQKTKISEIKENVSKEPKDNRNLQLMRLSVIRSGTLAANNMSEFDAKRREQILLSNKRKLSMSSMIFVSPTRLVIHNIPKSMTNDQLRNICLKASGDFAAKIKECRIWLNMNELNNHGKAKSMGFAFVEFTEHKHAVTCLTKLNNNSETFTDQKRPIVEFSLENRVALNLKAVRNKNKKNSDGAASSLIDDLTQTKRELIKQKLKPLPSHLGQKQRHRNKGKQMSVTTSKKKKLSRKEIRAQNKEEKAKSSLKSRKKSNHGRFLTV